MDGGAEGSMLLSWGELGSVEVPAGPAKIVLPFSPLGLELVLDSNFGMMGAKGAG